MKMKIQSCLINTSIGDMTNEKGLFDYLKKNYFSEVALDVFKNGLYNSNLAQYKRYILTPHIKLHTTN